MPASLLPTFSVLPCQTPKTHALTRRTLMVGIRQGTIHSSSGKTTHNFVPRARATTKELGAPWIFPWTSESHPPPSGRCGPRKRDAYVHWHVKREPVGR